MTRPSRPCACGTAPPERIDIVSMSVTKYLGGTLHFSIHVEV